MGENNARVEIDNLSKNNADNQWLFKRYEANIAINVAIDDAFIDHEVNIWTI